MAVEPAMFVFEVVIQKVESFSDSRQLVIRSDFADIFSLELKDPKQMHIVMPEPPPLPPDPPGKKKKAAPKPKKGKKGAVELPPPEPVIQSGQSVLFTSTAEFLIQSMRKFPMEVSLWSKEDHLSLIGSTYVPWDPSFLAYLEKICNCEEPPPISVNEEYNVFEEGVAKIMAKLGLQVKLSYLKDKVMTSFRTLSEDPTVKKYLYTGINSKITSYICNMKTTDEIYIENSNKIDNNYVVDKPVKKIAYADYKNAPVANLAFFNEGESCCVNHADKPPESIYKSPETLPDIDFIIDYVRRIIVSCNDSMRMLTPQSKIRPRVKATDIERLCYCKETTWPTGELSKRFQKEAQAEPCPKCINAGKLPEGSRGTTFDIANIRGPCGKHDCKMARDMRAYIENLVEEDGQEVKLADIIGPCGSKTCILVEKIHEFIRHEGAFSEGANVKGLSTQCACVQKMQDELIRRKECDSECSHECENSDSNESKCEGPKCPFNNKPKVYNVYYFTVQYDHDKDTSPSSRSSVTDDDKYKYCAKECPNLKGTTTTCSKSTCSTNISTNKDRPDEDSCAGPVCRNKLDHSPSPKDSEVELDFNAIQNLCSVKTCDIAETVKEFIIDGIMKKKNKVAIQEDDPCYCDCVCNLKFSSKTTYCAVCGGYECLGDDMKDQPCFALPYPCPVYHKLYDKKYIKVDSPWPDEETKETAKKTDNISVKSSKTGSRFASSKDAPSSDRRIASRKDFREKSEAKIEKVNKAKKPVGKYTANTTGKEIVVAEKKPEQKYPFPAVPKKMGWLWTAEDIPGLKHRPEWRPGAANKILVRRYRAMQEGSDMIAKKKRAMLSRKKKVDMKPTLVIKKQDGEYTVQMEVFKKYSKERLINQFPYEDKPPLLYSIGKTEEEKRRIQSHRERKERRETRRKSRLIQSTFKDRCQEICVKAYNQAIGLLPLPNPNDPCCPCETTQESISPPVDSCSCSDENSIASSDTDGDDWVIEFSPPAARYDAKLKNPPAYFDNETQYSYLDYKVKILDKHGNQVARYFKGPDGKQECSDLGGFWGPGHVWVEINKDGYIGPDNRWVPMNFIGPDGMFYSAEEGFFTDNTGQNLKIGIDGYIDKDGKWAWYRRRPQGKSKSTLVSVDPRKAKTAMTKPNQPETKAKASGGNAPKAGDKKGALKGTGDKSKKNVTLPGRPKSPLVMNLAVNYERRRSPTLQDIENYRLDPKKLAKYREIMRSLESYDVLGELKPPTKMNRASNTPRKKVSPFTMHKFSPIRHMPQLASVDSSIIRSNPISANVSVIAEQQQVSA